MYLLCTVSLNSSQCLLTGCCHHMQDWERITYCALNFRQRDPKCTRRKTRDCLRRFWSLSTSAGYKRTNLDYVISRCWRVTSRCWRHRKWRAHRHTNTHDERFVQEVTYMIISRRHWWSKYSTVCLSVTPVC